MQNIIIFINEPRSAVETPMKIGNMILNRFGIDEDGAFEILGIFTLKNQFGSPERDENIAKENLAIIDAGIQKAAENRAVFNTSHFVFSGVYYDNSELKMIILMGLTKYEIPNVSTIVTRLRMHRNNIITKERMEKYAEKYFLVTRPTHKYYNSVNDDFDDFCQKYLRQKLLMNSITKSSWTYFMPKLTNKEMKLVEDKNHQFFKTFWQGQDADIDENEMKRSESKSKFMKFECNRETFIFSLEAVVMAISNQNRKIPAYQELLQDKKRNKMRKELRRKTCHLIGESYELDKDEISRQQEQKIYYKSAVN